MILVKDFNISSINIGFPIKRKSGYGIEIKYDTSNIVIQTPICKVEKIVMKESIEENGTIIKPHMIVSFKLADNFEYFQFFCSVHELMIKFLCRCSENPNYEILSKCSGNHEEIRKNFVAYARKFDDKEMSLKMILHKNTNFFQKNTNSISGLEVKEGDYVICIINANQISVDEDSATHTWDCKQCLVWKHSNEIQIKNTTH